MKNYSESFVKTVLNESTGELESHRFTRDIRYNKTKKQGWLAMYKNGYDEVMMILNSSLEKSIFISIRDGFTKAQTEVNISQVNISKKFNTTKPTVNRLIKKLCEVGFLMKIRRGVYRMNPYILVPYQADGLKLQQDWDVLTPINSCVAEGEAANT